MKRLFCALIAMALVTGAFALAEDSGARAFAGRWGCGRATIDVVEQGDGGCLVSITWGGSAWQSAQWCYLCAYDADNDRLYTRVPGSKAVVTWAEDGSVASAETEYTDGEATFAIDSDGMLIWQDAKENAGEDMRFERGIGFGTPVNAFIDKGGFVVQVPVAEGDEGWMADDMSQDDSVVTLYDADILEGTFVARYEAAGDGDMAVCVKHMNGIACDEAFTWDLHVEDGAVRRFAGSSHRIAPEETMLSGYIEGEWQVNDDVMAGMTLKKNPDGGWAMEIRLARPDARLMRANVYYDCERDRFVYEGGTLCEYEIDDTPEGRVGDAIAHDVSGSLEMTTGEDGVNLVWYDALNPGATARFHRPEG